MKSFPIWISLLTLSAYGQDLSEALPQITQAPAPPSLVEGARLSYYGMAAIVPQVYWTQWRDMNGNWHEDEMFDKTGHGVTQVDIIKLTPTAAVFTTDLWSYSDWTGPLVPKVRSGGVCLPGGGDWWISPSVLAGLVPVVSEELTIIRGPQTFGGATYEVVRIQRETTAGRVNVAYDIITGFMVFKSCAVQGKGAITLSQMVFLGSRVRPPLAAGKILPGWVRAGTTLRYSGQYTIKAFASAPFTTGVEATANITLAEQGWYVYHQTVTIQGIMGMPPTIEENDLVGSGATGLYIDPAILEVTADGQIVDKDDRVKAICTARRTTDRVAFSTEAAGGKSVTVLTFDLKTGVLLELYSWDASSPEYTTESILRLTEQPTNPPPRPHLAIQSSRGIVTIKVLEANGRNIALEESFDGRSWHGAAANQMREGNTIEYNIKPIGIKAFYRAQAW